MPTKRHGFVGRYLDKVYTLFNNGKSGRQRREAKQIGKGKIRAKLKREMLEVIEDSNIWPVHK